ncbi:MAG: LuxR C-terminal-related transcriptional regulator [Myxococcales bacterium]|nr:LuxR C-terminal-related transcriptional regulator [Myxococcales bacterium]
MPRVKLSRRSSEIMELMAKGLTNAEIARVLALSASTVKGYVEKILQQLEVSNRTEAVGVYRMAEEQTDSGAQDANQDASQDEGQDAFAGEPGAAPRPRRRRRTTRRERKLR